MKLAAPLDEKFGKCVRKGLTKYVGGGGYNISEYFGV